MHSVWHRLNSLLTYGSTVLLAVCLLTSATGRHCFRLPGLLPHLKDAKQFPVPVVRKLAMWPGHMTPSCTFADFLVHKSNPLVTVKPAKIEAVSRGPEGDWVRLQSMLHTCFCALLLCWPVIICLVHGLATSTISSQCFHSEMQPGKDSIILKA